MDRYGELGVDYDVLDSSKRAALDAAKSTSPLIARHGGSILENSRGASAFVLELGGQQIAFVVEGLGTKSIIARQWLEVCGEDRFADIGVDTVGAIVNDVCSVGALPVVVNAYFATGRSDWHESSTALGSLLSGWRSGCERAGAVWGGGESPALPGLVSDSDIEVAGAAIGSVPGEWGAILGEELRAGDAIVLVASSGLHANGASLARSVADSLPEGLLTQLPSGERLGDALLCPSIIYTPLLAELRRRGVRPSYLSHVTGHGLRKLMRLPDDFTYVVDSVPPVPEVLEALAGYAGLDPSGAYGTFNMGAGFAVYLPSEQADEVVEAAGASGMRAWIAGHVEEGKRRVEIPKLGIVYEGSELDLSAQQ
jgi:phosphoribosylformylglycinamidine cyclo-ligase